jgi:hypothetical protein
MKKGEGSRSYCRLRRAALARARALPKEAGAKPRGANTTTEIIINRSTFASKLCSKLLIN